MGEMTLIDGRNHHAGILNFLVLRLSSVRILVVLKNQPAATISRMPVMMSVKLLMKWSTMSSTARPAPVTKMRLKMPSMIQIVRVVFFLLRWNLSDIAVEMPSMIENSESIARVIRQK